MYLLGILHDFFFTICSEEMSLHCFPEEIYMFQKTVVLSLGETIQSIQFYFY